MKKLIVVAAALTGLLGSAQATVLDFDDLAWPGRTSEPGILEHGFQFSYNTVALDVSTSGGFWSNGVNGGHSGNYAALNAAYGDMIITQADGNAFSVQDLWINGWQGKSMDSTIQGWLGGRLVDSVAVSYGSPWQNVALGFGQVDRLVILARNGSSAFLIDDLQVGAVPEPASLALFGLAAGMLALARRRKA